jgi:hypothetical protein
LNERNIDHPTRSLSLNVLTSNGKRASKIFIPPDRYYPDGFTLAVDKENVGVLLQPGIYQDILER